MTEDTITIQITPLPATGRTDMPAIMTELRRGPVRYRCTFAEARRIDAFARRTLGRSITQRAIKIDGVVAGYTLTLNPPHARVTAPVSPTTTKKGRR